MEEGSQVDAEILSAAEPAGEPSRMPRDWEGCEARTTSAAPSGSLRRRAREGVGETGGTEQELTEEQLRKHFLDRIRNLPRDQLKRLLRLMEKRQAQENKFAGLKKVVASGLGVGKMACPGCEETIDGACHRCPQCEYDVKGPKMEARKAQLDAWYEEGELGGKYYNPSKVMRTMKETMEDMHAMSGHRVHVALFWAYKTNAGKWRVHAFGIGRGGEAFVKDDSILPRWGAVTNTALANKAPRHQPDRVPPAPRASEACDFSGIKIDDLLNELQMPNYIPQFAEDNVSMESLKDCTAGEMVDLLRMKAGDAMMLKSKIQALRRAAAGSSRAK